MRALALSFLILAAVVPDPAHAQADCRLDWNGDGAINDRDLYHYDANKPDDQCGLSGFYAEWYLYTGYPENYALCFPEADPARLDYNHDGVVDNDDYIGRRDASAESEGFYDEWYIYTYYTHDWGALVPEYNCDEYHRGNPDDFPQAPDQMPTCEEACQRMGACGSADHPIYPMTTAECLDVCEMFREKAPGNPDYVDMRAFEFEACTNQPTCEQVEGCGGWLYRPHLADEICPTYCQCSFGTIIFSDPGDGLTCESPVEMSATPLEGFRLSGRRVYVSRRTEPRSGSFDHLRAEHVENHGNYSVLTYDAEIDQKLLAQLAGDAIVLPTFEDDSGRVAAATGTLFVKPGSKEGLDAIHDRLERRGLRLSGKMKGDRELYRVEASDGWDALELYGELAGIEGATVQLDMVREYEWHYQPTDPMFADQWHLQNDGDELGIASVDGRVAEAWDVTRGSSNVVLGILDSGVDLNHPEFAGRLLPPYNYPEDWAAQIVDGFASHGTAVAGVAGASTDNGLGVAGICGECKILPGVPGVVAPGGGGFSLSDQDVANAFIEMVDRGAWVINNSWGPGGPHPLWPSFPAVYEELPEVIANAFHYAETVGRDGKGTIIVFSAGNSNHDASLQPYIANPNVIGVGAVDDQGLKSYYSSFGDTVDIAAPSNGGLRGITTTQPQAEPRDGSDYRDDFGGTSSAAPFITGVIGLVLSANEELTAAEVRQIIENSGRKIDPVWGRWEDGHSPFYGAGLIDARAAVMYATGACAMNEACITPSDVCTEDCHRVTCDECRTDLDCAAGYECHAMPGLGMKTCVTTAPAGGCGALATEENGYCLPTREYCGLCEHEEPGVCDWRDTDCDGTFWDPETCTGGGPRCFQSNSDCDNMWDGTDWSCAATFCWPSPCETDADCLTTHGYYCSTTKNRYGDINEGERFCRNDPARFFRELHMDDCLESCPHIVATLREEEWSEFQTCVEDRVGECVPDLDTLRPCTDILFESLDAPVEP